MPYWLIAEDESESEQRAIPRKIDVKGSERVEVQQCQENAQTVSRRKRFSALPIIDDVVASIQDACRLQEQERLEYDKWLAQRSLSRLPDDIISRVLSCCSFADQRSTALTSYRMLGLVGTYQESAAKISFHNDFADLSSMYPESINIFPTALKRYNFLNRLQAYKPPVMRRCPTSTKLRPSLFH